jgi:5-formyltetrahydrofolate cyclo-ligase
MVPTYFRRELRDRVFQRRSRLRTFIRQLFAFTPQMGVILPVSVIDRESRMSASPANASKAELRAAALSARDKLTSKQRTSAALALAKRGLPLEIKPGDIVSGYSPIRSEIDPAPLMQYLAAQGARLALPAVLARGKSLVFRAWSPNDRLMLGPLGILEPSPGASELIPDIMLVPLAAFDRLGHRIGYGAGHYDYTLAHLRSQTSARFRKTEIKPVIAIGLAFAAQEIQAVPALSHDVALDYVLTEKKVFDCRIAARSC